MDTEYDSYFLLIKTPHIARDVAMFLSHLNCVYLPELVQNRNLFSFRNGLYFTIKDRFIPYQIEGKPNDEQMSDVKDQINQIPSNIKTASASERIVKKEKNIVSCNYFDVIFQDWKDEKQFKSTMVDPLPEDIEEMEEGTEKTECISDFYEKQGKEGKRSVPDDITQLPPNSKKQKMLKEWMDRDSKRTWKSRMWTAIDTPAFESILDSQKFSDHVKWWFYALMGMALYFGGEKDGWQVAVLILGYAGTGKSTCLRIIREFYKLEHVGILSNNIERQWALSGIYDKYVVLGYEVKKDFNWEQGEFQNAVTHEEVLVMIKFKTAFAHPFLAPIFMAGNEMITAWQDNSGSLARRLVIIYFRHFIIKGKSDPRLHQKLIDELPDLLQKFNRAYLEAVQKYGDSDIWTCLPKEFKTWNEEAMSSSNPLWGFLRSHGGGILITGDKIDEEGDEETELFCSFADFKSAFKMWCIKEGHTAGIKASWTIDFYRSIFDRMKIRLEKSQTRMNQAGQEVTKDFLYGVSLSEDWKSHFESHQNNDSKNKL